MLVSAEVAEEKMRLTVKADGYVPRPSIETSYPLPLIKKLIEVKGPIWFADEIARDEDPTCVQRTPKWATLPFIDPSELSSGGILDFGYGAGASAAILARTYPNLGVVGIELEPSFIEAARARAEFYGLSNLKMLASPAPDRLPDGIAEFDFINLSAVFEHLLPN